MNGIASLITFDERSAQEMLLSALKWTEPPFAKNKTSHRTHSFQNVCLGTTSSDSIACDPKGDIWVVVAGQLFNKEEISLSYAHLPDAACVMELYLEKGSDGFSKLDGEFAILILDKRTKELYAIRDRLGCYPLYWHVGPQLAIFSTSLKAILATGSISPTPDMMGLAASQTLGFISQDATSIVGVNRLIGGYYLKMSLKGTFTINSYWSFSSTFSKAYASAFDSSLDIYCELERHVGKSIETRKTEYPACLSGELGSYLIWNKLKEYQLDAPLVSIEVTPRQFLDSLVSMVWAMEMPNSDLDAARQWHFIKWCQDEERVPYFDTGFAQEFYDYTKDALALYEAHPAKHYDVRPSMASKIAFSLAPSVYLRRLRKSQQASPQIAFLERQLIINSKEFSKAAPNLSHHFDLNIFIHQFYNLSHIPKLDASLFYLSMKTFVAEGTSECRLRLAQSHGLTAQSPLIDWRLLEFFASFSPEIWASPDLLAAFPSFWLQEHETPTQISKWPKTPPIPEQLLLSPEVWAVLQGLESGLLVESGLILPFWIKKALSNPKAHLQALYAMLILEIWMRLFIDLPLREEHKEMPLQDLLQRNFS